MLLPLLKKPARVSSHQKSKLALTAAASNFVPSVKVTPGRKLIVQRLEVLLARIDKAKPGIVSAVPGLNSIRRS